MSARVRPRARQKLEVFRAVADATYDWETWLSSKGRVRWINPAVQRITGYSAKECMAMARYPLPAVHPSDREKIAALIDSALRGSAGNDVEFRVLRADGSTRWAAISWQSFADSEGKNLGVRTSVRDIHERKLAEERLGQALVLVEQAAAARNQFLANMSHELRTPLQCILGYTQLLRQNETNRSRKRKLALIGQQTDSLLAIIGDVLDMAALQITTPELMLEQVELRPEVESVLQAFRPLADKGKVRLVTQLPKRSLRVIADRARLRQVLTNLIGNALKFTQRGSVTISARARKIDTTSAVSIEVKDTGIGIAEAALETIFDPFVQADASIGRRYGGTGLGLAIAKRLCEAMHGTLTARAKPGRGSTFTVLLPGAHAKGASRSTPEQVSTPQELSRERHKLRVLVVDDAAPVRELTCEMLRANGVQPHAAENGRKAVEMAKGQYDLILLDLQMPDLDGLTVAQLIRAQWPSDAQRPQIVALTADAFGRALALGPSGEMDGFLVKPIRLLDIRTLLDRVAALRLSGAEKRLPMLGDVAPAHGRVLLDERVLRDLAETPLKDGSSLLTRTVDRVLSDTGHSLLELTRALAQGDAKKSAHVAHRIKGNCLVVGATYAAALAQKVDDASQSGNLKLAHTEAKALRASYRDTAKLLRAIVV